jgi:hypothetical protein
MDLRDIVNQTIANMYNIYTDIGRIIQVIEEEAKNNNLTAVGDGKVTWENTYVYERPELWLPAWFARVYQNIKFENKAVGFCIHLGGERYNRYFIEVRENLEAAQIRFPFINISLIEMSKSITEVTRTDLNNILWTAGWHKPQWISNIESNGLVFSQEKGDNAKLITYFIDLFALNSKEKVKQLVVEPMVQMLAGNIDWVIKKELPIIKINSPGLIGG